MAERRQIYRCETCGNVAEILHGGEGALVCCGKNMTALSENTVDAAVEKHIPVLARDGNTCTVTVGSVPHPMEDKHYIELIELLTEARVYHAFLDPGKKPEASFDIHGEVLGARAYCNMHGLWKSQ